MIENWVTIPWYDNYQVSDMGNIKSLNFWKEKLLKRRYCWWYINCLLYSHWKAKSFLLHKLVMLNFLWNSNWFDVNHKNWIKTDNRLENLEYCTRSENIKHWYNLWLIKSNFKNKWKFWLYHPKSRKVKQFWKDWNFIKLWDSIIDIERSLWIPSTLISSVCRWGRKTTWWFIFKYIWYGN